MLKYLIYCVVLLSVVVISIDAQVYAYGTILRDDTKSFTCNGTGPQCADDCSTLLLCAANVATPFANISCQTSSPTTPYCLENTCSATPGNCSSASSFRCTDVGIFPDPTDCTRYMHCDETAGSSTIYVCPTGFIFNSKLNLCQMGTTTSNVCNTVDCSKKTNEIVVYKSNPAYYSFCFVAANGTRETIMYKCDFEEYQLFDPTVNMCKFNCKSTGYYQDPTNCSSYYICSGRPGAYKAEKLNCPSTYFFDGSACSKNSTKCTPGSLNTTSTSTTSTSTTSTSTTSTSTTSTSTTSTSTTSTSTTTTTTTIGPQ